MKPMGIWSKACWPRGMGMEQIGIGAFFYIASTAVIGVMSYAGSPRSDSELGLFFGLLVAAVVLSTIVASLLPALRDLMVEQQGSFSVMVALSAMACACLSVLEPLGTLFFPLCALLTGLSCTMLVVSWERGLSRAPLRDDLLSVPPALVVAVLCYFVYRALSFFSLTAADSWHVTVGVTGMLALLLAYSPEYNGDDQERGRARPFVILGSVAAVLATGGGIFAFLSGSPGSANHAPFTPYFPMEIVGAFVIALCCAAGRRLLARGFFERSAVWCGFAGVLAPTVLLAFGAVSGAMLVASSGNGLLWEASVWVLIVAALALGMRTSLYLTHGMVVGVLFAAWCTGQLLAVTTVLLPGVDPIAKIMLALLLGALYLAATARLIARRGNGPGEHPVVFRSGDQIEGIPSIEAVGRGEGRRDDAAAEPKSEEAGRVVTVEGACRQIGDEYGLTAREVEVLCLIAEGRSARFIAETLVISYNTARSHMRNVYEKLGIHAKQDVITLVHEWE